MPVMAVPIYCQFPYCRHRFENREALRDHSTSIHGVLFCHLCKRRSYSLEEDEKHYTFSHSERSLRVRRLKDVNSEEIKTEEQQESPKVDTDKERKLCEQYCGPRIPLVVIRRINSVQWSVMEKDDEPNTQ